MSRELGLESLWNSEYQDNAVRRVGEPPHSEVRGSPAAQGYVRERLKSLARWFGEFLERRLALKSPGGTYEFFDHAADVGIRCRAASVGSLFEAAARAMMEWAGPPPDGKDTVGLQVYLEAEDREEMLVRWLQEILYLFSQRHLYFVAAGFLRVTDTTLQGELLAKPWDQSSSREYQEIKAITYHQLRVYEEGGVWYASVILDI